MLDRIVRRSGTNAGRSPWTTVSVSIVLHGSVLAACGLVTLLAVGTIHEPRAEPLWLIVPPSSPPPALAAPLKGGRPRSPEARKTAASQTAPEWAQPQIVPEEAPPPEAISDGGEGDPRGVPDGDPNGSPEGGPGGIPGGVANGIPGGSPFPGVTESPSLPREEEPIRLTGEIRAPVRIFKIDPAYPEVARLSRVEGKVILEIVVDREGDVVDVRILKGHPLFDVAATEAVRRWRYDPALQDGRPVKVYMTVVVDFKLR